MQFRQLVQSIRHTHDALQLQAMRAVNRALTMRNWLIGCYIVEFEQRGEERAAYGEQLVKKLADALKQSSISNVHERELRRYRLFYFAYPQLHDVIVSELQGELIRGTVSPILESVIRQTASPKLGAAQDSMAIDENIDSTTRDGGEKEEAVGFLENQSLDPGQEIFCVPAEKLLNRLSFSHLTELLPIQDQLKRTFYELECIKGTWSVRELKRQINSLYYERMGLSKSPEKLAAHVRDNTEPQAAADIIKSIYTFEFLGLRTQDLVEEQDLETALLNHLQSLLLEMGRGYCFEARQQKLLIGDEYFFVDLVLYHRILKCHVLVELKLDAFSHHHAGQLNTYLNYYKKEVIQPGDNPPVGILLVANKNNALVEYATAGMDNALFVSKYLVQLPSPELLKAWVEKELRNW